jgi:hypothetical protein
MKLNFLRSATLTLPFLASGILQAAYNPAAVGADARWVIYADLNALRASAIGKELVATVEKAQAEATGGMVGIDVPKLLMTVGSVTAYGTNLASKAAAIDGTLIAQGTADLRKIAESLMLQGTLAQPDVFSEVKDLPFPAYAIDDPKAKAGDRMQLIVAFPPEPIVLVSKSKAQLLKARDVFRGTSPSLQKTPDSPLNKLATRAGHAFLFAATVVPTEPVFPKNAPQARILQLASSGAISFGERGTDTFAHAELLASSDDNAERLMKILQGMASMISLAETSDRQLTEFLNSTSVARDKDTVTLDLSYSSTRLAQMVQNVQAQAMAKPVNRTPTITSGKVLAEWGGDESPAASGTYTGDLLTQTITNVNLTNGSTVTVGRALNGGKNARFTTVEITPADGGGTPLVFKTEFMRNARGNMLQFQFPGADGTYTLKVSYVPDPEGKTKFAVSVAEPKTPGDHQAR